MTGFRDNVLNGLALGAVYALVALGFVVMFKASGVLNFAHGSILLLGGYLIAVLHDDLGFAGALALAVLTTAALAGALDRFLLQRAGQDEQSAHIQTIATIGIDILIFTDLARRIGGDLLSLGDPWGDSVTELGPVTVADSRLAAIAVSTVVIAAVFALFRFTPWGLSLRAAAEDLEAAALMGVRLRRVRALAWCLAGGLATLALVFLGHHVLLTWDSVTGGFNGRSVPPLTLGGFTFAASDPELVVLGVPFGAEERLWYLGLALFASAGGLLRGRPGRALAALRDSETAAAVLGVDVARHRSAAFVVSSMYAGLAGVLLALAFRRVVPDYFSLALSIDYLAMIVIGGLGSVAGATAGAVFVTALPLLMTRYADQLPLVTAPGSAEGSVGPTEAARYLYGAAIVLVLLYAPDGLHGLAHRIRARLGRNRPPSAGRSPVASVAAASSSFPSQPAAAAARSKEHTP
ncbi:hypothetical protein GCM10009535_21510 [Streptomyces thermocarboxydovorans]|uniref:Branched-chain amino acid ABC transporter permease n=1 Tax=Streptomyces thermocarboxydovorans TaxID=59298 RepID=A0ABN1HF89_9ACTN